MALADGRRAEWGAQLRGGMSVCWSQHFGVVIRKEESLPATQK
jgi:hypothetical protein